MKNNSASFVAVFLITALVITSGCTTVDQQAVDDAVSATVGAIQSKSVSVEATPLPVSTEVLPTPTVDLELVDRAVAATVAAIPTPTSVTVPTLVIATPVLSATSITIPSPTQTAIPTSTPAPTATSTIVPTPTSIPNIDADCRTAKRRRKAIY